MKKILLALSLAFFASAAIAQDTVDGAYNERVVVVGSYKPVLEETQKVNVAPTITDTATQLQHNFTYQITPKRLTALFSPTRIKAARVIGEPTTKLYSSYLKAGFGNYWSPLLEGYYNSTRHKTMTYGAYITHRSSWGTIGRKVDSIPFSPDYYGANHWSVTDLGGFAKYIFKDKLQFSADINYNNDYNLYYGVSDSLLQANGFNRDSLSLRDNRIAYNVVSFNAGVKNLQTDVNKLGYSANLGLDQLFATYGQKELNMNLTGDIHYGFPLLSKSKGIAYLEAQWIGEKQHAAPAAASWGYLGTLGDTLRHSRNIVKINPYVDFLFKTFNIHAGLKVDFDAYSDSSVHPYIFPDLMASKNFMSDALNLSLGMTGDVDANNLQSIRQVNPYLAPGASVMATHGMDFYAKARLNFNKKLQLNVHGDLAVLKNDLNFRMMDSTIYCLKNVYTSTYEDVTRATIGADFSFVNDEMLAVEIGANYHHYTDSLLLFRPRFDAHLNLMVNYNDKVVGKLQGLVIGQMNSSLNSHMVGSVEVVEIAEKLPMRAGLNLEVEYRHTKALSFFAKMDNILCQRYFYWTNYPSQRILVMLGLTYTIPSF